MAAQLPQARKTMCEFVCIFQQRLMNQYYKTLLAMLLRVMQSCESPPRMAFIFLERCETVE